MGSRNYAFQPFFLPFSSITTARFDAKESHIDFVRVLTLLGPDLSTLSITVDAPGFPHIDDSLSRFVNLRTLELDGPIFGSTLIPALLKLSKLTSLELSGNASVITGDFVFPNTGPTKLPLLRFVRILETDCESSRYGLSFRDPNYRYTLHPTRLAFFPDTEDWRVPGYSNNFPFAAIQTFLDLAEREGVDAGTHLQRIQAISAAFDEEIEACRIYGETKEGKAILAEEGKKRGRGGS